MMTGSPARLALAQLGSSFVQVTAPANVARLFSTSSGILPKAVLAAGISYLFLPIDLIPDRLGLVGHLDEAGFLLLGLSGGLALSLPRPPDAPARHVLARARMQRLAWRLVQRGTAGTPGRVVLRLILGRWPERTELAAFCDGLGATAHGLPPLLRAAAYVPAARPLLGRSMLLGAERGSVDRARPGDRPRLEAAQMMGDPLTLWRGPKVRFLHLEKTAGSSLIEVLAAQFHPLQIHSDPDRRHAGRTRTELDRLATQHREAAIVWGHYDLPSLRRLDGDGPCFLFCLLREPRARILSLYYFWRGNRDEPSIGVRTAQANGLLEFLQSTEPDIRNDIDNMYTRRFTGLYAGPNGDPLLAAPDGALTAALAAQDGLDFVGLSGRLGESLALLGRMLDFTPPARTPEVNVQAQSERNVMRAVRPTQREPITPEIDAELRRLTRLDAVLYAEAERRFQAMSIASVPQSGNLALAAV